MVKLTNLRNLWGFGFLSSFSLLSLSISYHGTQVQMLGQRQPHTRSPRARPVVVASKSRVGRIRRAVKREFILSDGRPILSRQVLERAYCRLRRFTTWHYLAVRRALRSEGATVIARNRFGRGRACLWAPKPMQHDATWGK